jgi:hypothetical protein
MMCIVVLTKFYGNQDIHFVLIIHRDDYNEFLDLFEVNEAKTIPKLIERLEKSGMFYHILEDDSCVNLFIR